MKTEKFNKNNILDMDPMHDSYANKISIEDKYLIIVYEDLDNGVLTPDGHPEYNNKKLTIRYEFNDLCEAKVYYSKNKFLYIDMLNDIDEFNKIIKNCLISSYKYSMDSFGKLMLAFDLNGVRKYKYWGIEIHLDIKEITYIWE